MFSRGPDTPAPDPRPPRDRPTRSLDDPPPVPRPRRGPARAIDHRRPRARSGDAGGIRLPRGPGRGAPGALGGAFASRADGVEATFWNPAGLAATTRLEIVGSHFEFFQQLRHEQFAFARPLWGGGASLGLRAMYSEPITERDDIGNVIGTFGGHDLEFSLAYGRTVGRGLRAGGSFQVVRERIAELVRDDLGGGRGPDLGSAPAAAALALRAQPRTRRPLRARRRAAGQAVSLPAAVQGGASYGVAVGTGFELRGSLETRLTRGGARSRWSAASWRTSPAPRSALGYRANDDATNLGFGRRLRVLGAASRLRLRPRPARPRGHAPLLVRRVVLRRRRPVPERGPAMELAVARARRR